MKNRSRFSSGRLRREFEMVSREKDIVFGFSARKQSKPAIWKRFSRYGLEKQTRDTFYRSSGAWELWTVGGATWRLRIGRCSKRGSRDNAGSAGSRGSAGKRAGGAAPRGSPRVGALWIGLGHVAAHDWLPRDSLSATQEWPRGMRGTVDPTCGWRGCAPRV